MVIRIYCLECGFLNIAPRSFEKAEIEKCKACLKELSPEGMLKELETTIEYFGRFIVRKEMSFHAIKKDIENLEKNKSVIQEIIQKIKKRDSVVFFSANYEITDLLKQVLTKNLTPEKIGLEKSLQNAKQGLAYLYQELERDKYRAPVHLHVVVK